jgi:hypothetical protein
MIINPEGFNALIAQLGERQTEDLKVLCSIHSQGIYFSKKLWLFYLINDYF